MHDYKLTVLLLNYHTLISRYPSVHSLERKLVNLCRSIPSQTTFCRQCSALCTFLCRIIQCGGSNWKGSLLWC